MADLEWIRNLAEAEFVGGTWQPSNPEKVKSLTRARIVDALDTIYDQAQLTADIFNSHTKADKQIRVLKAAPTPTSGEALLLLVGSTKLELRFENGILQERLVQIAFFREEQSVIHQFAPLDDGLGTVVWVMDSKQTVTIELLIKQIFRDLLQAHSFRRPNENQLSPK